MAINTNLLVQADVLQQYLVDKDTGTPLAAGKITLYKDNKRQELKNWYYQTGAPNQYSYIALPNPMTLSSVGTMQDDNGNDIIPLLYPYDEDNSSTTETYYIKVESATNILQFTRENFPFLPEGGNTGDTNPTYDNYIVNGEYWHNVGTLNVKDIMNVVVAGSQHDNYNVIMDLDLTTLGSGLTLDQEKQEILKYGSSDIRFLKSQPGDQDTVEFVSLINETLEGGSIKSVSPSYALRLTCQDNTAQASFKCIQYPISMGLHALQNQTAHLLMWAKSGGGAQNTITVKLYRYTGAGALEASDESAIGPNEGVYELPTDRYIPINTNFNFPDSTAIVNENSGGDAAYFLRIYYPVGSGVSEFNILHTLPQVFLGSAPSEVSYRTPDQINSIVNAPRTGDVKFTSGVAAFLANTTSYNLYGWVPMDDGTIGNYVNTSNKSNASTRQNQDTWPLFNLLWHANQFSQGYAPMYTSAGVPIAYGASAIDDFKAFRKISLLKALGRVLAGTVAYYADAQTFTASPDGSDLKLTVSNNNIFGNGSPVILFNTGSGGALPPNLESGQIYYTFIKPTAGDNTSLWLYAEKENPATPTTTPKKPWEYTRLPNVKGASTADLVATYTNGTSGVGAILKNNAANAAFTRDGVTYAVGDYILVKDQGSNKQNGIYKVKVLGDATTPWELVRATYFDEPKEMQKDMYVFVEEGTANANKQFKLDNGVISIQDNANGSSITFSELTFTLVQWAGAGTGTQYIQLYVKNLDQYGGEYNHQLKQNNIPSPLTTNLDISAIQSGSGANKVGTGFGGVPISVVGGGNVPMSIQQPTTFLNIYIKL